MTRDFHDVIQPLCLRADGRARQRILIKLAYILAAQINEKQRLKKTVETK